MKARVDRVRMAMSGNFYSAAREGAKSVLKNTPLYEFARRFEGGADLVVGERMVVADAPVPSPSSLPLSARGRRSTASSRPVRPRPLPRPRPVLAPISPIPSLTPTLHPPPPSPSPSPCPLPLPPSSPPRPATWGGRNRCSCWANWWKA